MTIVCSFLKSSAMQKQNRPENRNIGKVFTKAVNSAPLVEAAMMMEKIRPTRRIKTPMMASSFLSLAVV